MEDDMTFSQPNAADLIEGAHSAGRLRAGSWGGSEAVCMMSALVSGAQSVHDCATAGWPEWLAALNVELFDADVGAPDEDEARYRFALDVARVVQVPRDYDRAADLFFIARLDTGEFSALKTLRGLDGGYGVQVEAVERVVALLRRRTNGEDVAAEMAAARTAASDAARTAASDAASAAESAASAARAAASAAWAAAWAAESAAASAAWAAASAAWAAESAAARAAESAAARDAESAAWDAARAAARGAARAAARNDLVAALRAA
jgi:hypothetical protein